ncbi:MULTISPECIES: DUF1858 domain-containing protein [unclassified Nitratiruptor]|uniref:DUF1858 domain-containing protein n=1 Tax=unclassified Nitratiruptor TaxID=2624044 RepID=UPI001916164B|nr:MULTISPECIES: DUF1858 domain-containing protein [unclassified Nitratiruptor]BCD61089.1 hypothetical protein NitYY0810_C1870 [Nitratiruptor sp. YY08-10]BCD65022.1 hypothetical protein NitYY0814_C1879 [Nitratiruptor sp. YY08-14]
MEITLDTKIADLLKEYPFLEEELIKINPKFKKLKNPILRRTVAKIASVKQAAVVGGMDPVDLVNQLRSLVGQEPLAVEVQRQSQEIRPDWSFETPSITLDADKLLDEGKNPLAEVTKELKSLPKGSVLVLTSDFKPEPLIDTLKEKGYKVFCDESTDQVKTYISS